MEQLIRECPACQSNGRHQLLELRQINLTTAAYVCRFEGCTYPAGYSWIYVSRNVCDVSDNDSDSDSGILDYDDTSSIMSEDTYSVISNVSQCRIDSSLTDPVTSGECSLNNSSNIVKDNSVKLLSSSTQVDIPVRKDIVINNVDRDKNCLKFSINLANSSDAASSNSKSTVDVTTEGSNDNINVDISKSKDTNLQSNNTSNETSNMATCNIKITVPDMYTCAEVLDIANIPIVLADSEEGKKLLESVNQTNVSLPVNTTRKARVKKLLITKPVIPLSRAQQLLKLQRKTNRVNSKEIISRYDFKQIINTVPEAACKAVLDYRKKEREKLKNIKVIAGKHVSNDLTSSAARFDGFQFKSTIIKLADMNNVCKVHEDTVQDGKKNSSKVGIDNSTDMKSVNIDICKETNLEEMALDDFFNNIDKMEPVNIACQSINTDEVDELLKSLCSYQ